MRTFCNVHAATFLRVLLSPEPARVQMMMVEMEREEGKKKSGYPFLSALTATSAMSGMTPLHIVLPTWWYRVGQFLEENKTKC